MKLGIHNLRAKLTIFFFVHLALQLSFLLGIAVYGVGIEENPPPNAIESLFWTTLDVLMKVSWFPITYIFTKIPKLSVFFSGILGYLVFILNSLLWVWAFSLIFKKSK